MWGNKTGLFTDKELTLKTKWDLWRAAIGSIPMYSLTTKQTETMGTKLQTFVSKCMRNIVDKEEEEGKRGTIERERKGKRIEEKEETGEPEQRKSNIEYRNDTSTPTIMSYIEKAKLCDIYRGETTMSAAYLNEKTCTKTSILEAKMGDIKGNYENKRSGTLTQTEDKIIEDLKSFAKKRIDGIY